MGNLDHGPQLDFRISRQAHAHLGGAADVELRDDRRASQRGRIVVDHQGPRAERCVVGQAHAFARTTRVKRQRQVADFQAVAVFQRLAALDLAAVDERAVAAVQVLDVIAAVFLDDLRVLAADRGGVEENIAVGMPPQDGTVAIERVLLAAAQRLKKLQHRHGSNAQRNASVP